MARIVPQRRPHYGPHERMAILELRAARGWSLKQTADTFFLTSATIASWVKRIEENGPDALLQLREPEVCESLQAHAHHLTGSEITLIEAEEDTPKKRCN